MHNWQFSNPEIQKDPDSFLSSEQLSNSDGNMPLWFQNAVWARWLVMSHLTQNIRIRIAVSHVLWINRVIMPPYVQTLNFIHSNESLGDSNFLKDLSESFPMGTFSTKTLFSNLPSGIRMSSRDNYILPLDSSYENIRSGYDHGHRQGINKFYRHNFTITECNDVQHFLDFYIQHRPSIRYSSHQDRKILFALLSACLENGKGKMLQALSPSGVPVGCAFFVYHQNKIVYLISAKNKEGKTFSAIHSLLDYVIQKNSGQQVYVDFEGSMNPNIAYFMKAFGSQKEIYYVYEWNFNPLIRIALKIKRWLYPGKIK